jgi:hypothetical protein
MARLHPSTNPFALMMEPEAIFRALESSERLNRLKSRICRPLDQPLIAKTEGNGAAEVAEFDRAIEVDPTIEAEAPGDAVEDGNVE